MTIHTSLKETTISSVLPINFPDWKTIYNTAISEAAIPATTSTDMQGISWIKRAPYIDLSEVQDEISKLTVKPVNIFLYAAVVHIPANFGFSLVGQSLNIFSRRIEALNNGVIYLTQKDSKDAILNAYFMDVGGNPQIISVINNLPPETVTLKAPDEAGITYINNGDTVTEIANPEMPSQIYGEATPLWSSLITNFQIAAVLFQDNFTVTDALLSWVKQAAAYAPESVAGDPVYDWRLLFAQTVSFQANLQASAKDGNFVPALSKDIYDNLMQGFVSAAESAQTQYDRFSDKKETIEARKQAAELMLADEKDALKYTQKLLDQAEGNYLSTNNAVFQAKINLDHQNATVEVERISFQTGLDLYRYEQGKKLAWGIFTGIMEFAVAIPLMLAGDPAAAGAAGGAAKAASEAVVLAKKMKEIADQLGHLQKLVKATVDLALAIKAEADLSALVDKLKGISISSDKAIALADPTEWKIFSQETDNQLAQPISLGIGGAGAYKVALNALSLYGQALGSAHQSEVIAGQKFIELKLQLEMKKQQFTRLEKYIKDLTAQNEPNDDMMQQMYQRNMDMRRSMFVSVLNYTEAFYYWALEKSTIQPSMFDTVTTMKKQLAQNREDYALALKQFKPPPQSFQDIKITFDDPAILESLISNNKANVFIPIDSSQFFGLYRVRLTIFRIWLNGLDHTSAPEPIYLQIRGTGVYDDKYNNQTYQFTSDSLKRIFKYEIKKDGTIKIIVDGKVSDEQKFAYFEPTPFSGWEIIIPTELDFDGVTKPINVDLDLTKLTSMELEFSGSVIGT